MLNLETIVKTFFFKKSNLVKVAQLTGKTFTQGLVGITSLLFTTTMFVNELQTSAKAQIVPDTTLPKNTIVPPNCTNCEITGGTNVGNNVFHSFEKFGLLQGQIANFRLNESNTNIQSILSRVTGGDASIINGLIKITGGNSPNLYLMNPAGIVFGANAKLDVPAAFIGTTANGIGVGNNWFNAEGSNNYQNLTETPNILAFSLDKPGAIVNAAENLEPNNRDLHLVLVGGTVVSTKPISLKGTISIVTVTGQSLIQLDSQVDSFSGKRIPVFKSSTSLPANNPPANWTRTPKTLPELLTGGNAGNADKLTVNSDGTVLLKGSGVQVQNGDVILTEKVDTNFNFDERNYSSSNGLQVLAGNNIFAGDIVANGNGIKISGASINANNIERTYAGRNSEGRSTQFGVDLKATAGNILVEDINTNALDVNLLAQGGISSANIRTFNNDLVNRSSVNLTATTSNIQVGSITTGSGGIYVKTPGTFRATDTSLGGGSKTDEFVVGQSPEIIEFLVRQGVSRERLVSSKAKITVTSSANANVVTTGKANITHGGEGRPTSDGITINGNGSFAFVSGGFVSEPEKYRVESGNLQKFDTERLTLSRIYSIVNPAEVPNDVSVVTGIVTLDGTNQQLIGSLESRPFVPPSNPGNTNPGNTNPGNTNPGNTNSNSGSSGSSGSDSGTGNNNPLSGAQQQTAQRQLNTQTNNSACDSSNIVTTAYKPTNSGTSNRNTKISSPPTGANIPCSTTQDEQQILQILNETLNLDKNKKLYFDSSYLRLPDYAE